MQGSPVDEITGEGVDVSGGVAVCGAVNEAGWP